MRVEDVKGKGGEEDNCLYEIYIQDYLLMDINHATPSSTKTQGAC